MLPRRKSLFSLLCSSSDNSCFSNCSSLIISLINICLITVGDLEGFYIFRCFFRRNPSLLLDNFPKGLIYVFCHSLCISTNIEMGALFQPIVKFLSFLQHSMLHIMLLLLIPRKGNVRLSQQSFFQILLP